MGVVYSARDLAFQRDVVLKYLQPCFADNPTAVARFVYESQLTGRLQHPGISPVHQVGKLADGRPYLVMKLIHGQTLDRLLRQEGPGAGRWLGVFEAICQAVGYAHSQGVIHRDLKPGNVMVGEFGEVQVMDWGLAKVLPRDGERTSRDRQGAEARAGCPASRDRQGAEARAGCPASRDRQGAEANPLATTGPQTPTGLEPTRAWSRRGPAVSWAPQPSCRRNRPSARLIGWIVAVTFSAWGRSSVSC